MAACAGNAGDAVDSAEFFRCGSKYFLDGFCVCYVDLGEEDFGWGLEGFLGGVKGLLVDVADADEGAALEKLLDSCEADARGSAGYEDDFVLEGVGGHD